MSKKEIELLVSPANLVKDLAAIGLSVKLNDNMDVVITGLITAETNGTITDGAKKMIIDTIKAMKPQLISFLQEEHCRGEYY